MDQPSSQADHLNSWQRRLRALDENAEDAKQLESPREKLRSIISRTQSAFQVQSAATAARQEASRQLEALVAEGRLVMAFLNAGIREYYGKDSEKLAEFGLQPFRGRRVKVQKPEPVPPQPEDVKS